MNKLIMNTIYEKNIRNIHYILLVIVHLILHYLPFERQSLGADTYVNINRFINSNGFLNIIDYFKFYSNRPINIFTLDIQNYLILYFENFYLILLFLSSLFLTFSIYYLFQTIFKNHKLSFLAVIIYELYPSKFEIFQNNVFVNTNLNSTIYILN